MATKKFLRSFNQPFRENRINLRAPSYLLRILIGLTSQRPGLVSIENGDKYLSRFQVVAGKRFVTQRQNYTTLQNRHLFLR